MTYSENPTISEVGVMLERPIKDVHEAALMAGVRMVNGRISWTEVGKIRRICEIRDLSVH